MHKQHSIFQSIKFSFIVLSLVIGVTGCGSNSKQAILPTGQLTDEQKAAIKAADTQVDEEESQGNFNKRKR